MLEHLAYLSVAAPHLAEDDIQRILEHSRRNNPKMRITGHLQCHGGHFFQVLEGPGAALNGLLDKLGHDPRHSDFRLLYREPMTGRNFANWSMGYSPGSQGPAAAVAMRKLQGLRDIGTASAQRVLAVFFSLMEPVSGDRSAGGPRAET
jgi:hypothetical protein